jgi:heterotetrameric sarcosine oxidase gamma subunit
VPELIAKAPLVDAPITLGQVTLAPLLLPRLTSVAPLQGQDKAVAKALKSIGLKFPAPNQTVTKDDAMLIWTGRNQAFLMGADPAPLIGLAALTDQTDGWAGLSLTGPQGPDVLARLIPLDLRSAAFPIGRAVRVPVNHMHAILMRRGAYDFSLLVFRSMAQTAWHELKAAMHTVATRAGVT